LEVYTRALRSARKLVYLESQFLWSAQVVGILANKLRAPPSDEFQVVVLLPAKPNNGADKTRGQLGVLADADNREGRFLATTISARSVCDPRLARETRLPLWAGHLERRIEDVSGEPAQVIDELWRPIAREQLERRHRGEPLTHRLQELP
jgi:hypothetical protein